MKIVLQLLWMLCWMNCVAIPLHAQSFSAQANPDLGIESLSSNQDWVGLEHSFSELPSNGQSFWWIGAILDPHRVDAADLSVFIEDESPQPQRLRVGTDLESTNRSFGGMLGIILPAGGRWLGSLDISVAGASKTNVWAFNFGTSYQLGKGNFIFAPGLSLGGGRGNIKLGKITRTTPFIEIDGKQFLGDEIEVKLREAFLSIQPEVNFYARISEKTGLRLNFAYRRAGKYRERIFLDGSADSENTEDLKARLKLSDSAISFIKNEQSTDKGGLQQFSGFKAELAFTFSIR